LRRPWRPMGGGPFTFRARTHLGAAPAYFCLKALGSRACPDPCAAKWGAAPPAGEAYARSAAPPCFARASAEPRAREEALAERHPGRPIAGRRPW